MDAGICGPFAVGLDNGQFRNRASQIRCSTLKTRRANANPHIALLAIPSAANPASGHSAYKNVAITGIASGSDSRNHSIPMDVDVVVHADHHHAKWAAENSTSRATNAANLLAFEDTCN